MTLTSGHNPKNILVLIKLAQACKLICVHYAYSLYSSSNDFDFI